MKIALLALVLALLAVAALTPLVRAVAFRLGAVTHPGGRHVHQKSIPRLGGLAICAGFFVAIGALYFADATAALAFRSEKVHMLGLAAGGLAMCAVGAVDDTRGIRALHKLFLQVAVAVIPYACGFRILGVHVPLLGDIDTVAMALPLTVLWIVGIINAINLIDGLDGLAAGVVFFAATTNLVVAWLNGTAHVVAWISAAVAGSTLGFLIYNFNPARIFMGDSGSYFLGYVLAVTALMGTQKASTAVSLLVPVMALGLPIFDTLFAMVRRVLERRSVFSPDRGHIHHRLLDMGITHRRAVMILYAACGVFTIAAIGVSIDRTWQVGVALFAASAALIGLVRFVGYFEYIHLRSRQRERLRSRDAELLRRALPKLPQRFAGAVVEDELVEELWRFAVEADLGFVEVLDTSNNGDREPRVHRWPSVPSGAERDMVTASYPLGADGVARSAVRFGWHSDFGDVQPQSEILLQIAADLLAENLERLHSALMPASEPIARPVSEPPDALQLPARPSRV